MADYTANIDSALTLEQTKNRCEVEQNRGFRLDTIKEATLSEGGKVLNVNKAEFTSDPFDWLRTLLFIDLGADDPDKIQARKEGEGWTWICNSKIYVENKPTTVMVVGR